jgi:hypothetical protein
VVQAGEERGREGNSLQKTSVFVTTNALTNHCRPALSACAKGARGFACQPGKGQGKRRTVEHARMSVAAASRGDTSQVHHTYTVFIRQEPQRALLSELAGALRAAKNARGAQRGRFRARDDDRHSCHLQGLLEHTPRPLRGRESD